MGRLIPAGTGLEHYRNFKLLTEVEPPQAEPAAVTDMTAQEPLPASPGVAPEIVDEDEAHM
jgi:hypothetical protein